jgi:outer membrane scaffolding protein for murein synthesis (MipA/OmpV family)
MSKPTPALTAALLGVLVALSVQVKAQDEPGPKPLWEVGVVGLSTTQQAYPGSDQRVQRTLPLPYALYRGQWLRAENNTIGLRAMKTPSTEIDVGFAGSFGSRASESRVRQGMPDIGTLVEFGPRLKLQLGALTLPLVGTGKLQAQFPLRGVFDLSDGFASRGLAFEPELSWGTRTAGGVSWGVNVGALIGSEKLTDTFYEVAPPFARPGRPAYGAQAGLISLRGGLSGGLRVAPDWFLFAYARVDSVASATNRASPMVQRTTGASAGIGFIWTGMRSPEKAFD